MIQPKENLILSTSNSKIKRVVALQEKHSLRVQQNCFVVEGVRELLSCIQNDFAIETLFFCSQIIQEELLFPFTNGLDKNAIWEVSENVYQRIAYRSGSEGVIAIVRSKFLSLDEIKFINPNQLIIVAEGVEKPGNLGAILRTADAVGADAVLFCNCSTDLYNPNLIRASLGGVFTQQIVCCSSNKAIEWLKSNNIKIFTAQLQDSDYYYNTDMVHSCAIVVGSEADGLSQLWREASDEKILIPMQGQLDSLNVSISTAILCYEALRQRNKDKLK